MRCEIINLNNNSITNIFMTGKNINNKDSALNQYAQVDRNRDAQHIINLNFCKYFFEALIDYIQADFQSEKVQTLINVITLPFSSKNLFEIIPESIELYEKTSGASRKNLKERLCYINIIAERQLLK